MTGTMGEMMRVLWMSSAGLLTVVPLRHAALGLLGSGLALGLAGWVSATPPETRAAASPEPERLTPTRLDTGGDILRVGRIAAFVASTAEPRAARNPFALAPSGVRAEPEPIQQPARLEPAVPISPIAATGEDVAPALIGIAEQATPRGPGRTAVFMSRDGSVEFAAPGERVGNGRFLVTAISEDVVVIIRSATGVTTRHALQ